MNHYRAYGLRIHTSLALPELPDATDRQTTADVIIRPGQLGSAPSLPPCQDRHVKVREDGVYFFWPAVGAFLASKGETIIYDVAPDVTESTVRLPLLGAVLGTVLHQRGFITLHASAVLVDDAVVAFVGWKGAGKSTMAAFLHERGHCLMTDDVLALENTNDRALVHPAIPQIKLLPDAIAALGKEPQDLAPLGPSMLKRALRTTTPDASALTLRRIYVLAEGPVPSITPLSPRDAFIQLLSHTYAPRFLGTAGTSSAHFHRLLQITHTTPVCRLERPRNLPDLPRVAQLVEAGSSQLPSR